MNRAARRKRAKSKNNQWNNQRLQQLLKEGVDLQRQGDYDKAAAIYHDILRQCPTHYDAMQLLGAIASHRNKWEEARDWYIRSLKLRPDQANVWFNLARVYYCVRALDGAVEAFGKAIECKPDYADAYYNRGTSYCDRLHLEEAVADFEKALALQPDHPLAGRSLALAYRDMYRYDDAIAKLKDQIERHPENDVLHTTIALVYRDIGDKDAAIVHLKRALELNPGHAETHYKLSVLHHKKEQLEQHIPGLETLLEKEGRPNHELVYLHFALAKSYDDLGDYNKAFEHYDAGNEYERSGVSYTTDKVRGYFKRIEKVFTPLLFEKGAPEAGVSSHTTPIFILGMPRSGTSLMEQIISSHSDVEAAGERDELHYVVTGNPWEKRENYLDAVTGYDAKQFAEMGAEYQKRLEARFGTPAYLTDKMPMNFHYVGMIKLMLPHAKVIHCVRHPLDTCLSVYRRLFWGRQPYAYNQTELAEHHQLYQELMAYWHSVLPGFIHDVNYETLIENPEQEIAAMLDFCGLEWQDSCINFHKNKSSVVRTASAEQVRQPLYKDSMQGWKRYQDYIQPMIDVLGIEPV